ncbi:hypothetical protein ACOME3_009556 [Neoechinorhynchus agilis]
MTRSRQNQTQVIQSSVAKQCVSDEYLSRRYVPIAPRPASVQPNELCILGGPRQGVSRETDSFALSREGRSCLVNYGNYMEQQGNQGTQKTLRQYQQLIPNVTTHRDNNSTTSLSPIDYEVRFVVTSRKKVEETAKAKNKRQSGNDSNKCREKVPTNHYPNSIDLSAFKGKVVPTFENFTGMTESSTDRQSRSCSINSQRKRKVPCVVNKQILKRHCSEVRSVSNFFIPDDNENPNLCQLQQSNQQSKLYYAADGNKFQYLDPKSSQCSSQVSESVFFDTPGTNMLTSASTQWRSEEASVTHLYSDPIANGNLRQSLQVRQTQSQQAYRGRADNQQLPTNSTTLCNILGANSLCQIVDPRWNAQVAHSSLNYAANRKKSQHSSASLVSEKNGAHSKAFNIEHNQSTQNVHQYKLSRSKAVDGVAEVQLHCSNEQKSRLQSHAEKKIIYHPTNLHVQNVDSIDPKMICKKSINRRTGQIAVATTNTGLKFLLNLNIFNTHSALEIPNPKRKEPRMSDIKSLNNYYFSMPIPTNAELLEYKMSNLDLNANETRVAQPQTIVEYKFTEMAKSAIFTSRDVKSETIKERLESKLEEQRKAQEIITDMDPWEEEYVARMAATKQSKNTRKSKTTEMTARERFWAFAGLEKPSSDEFS